MGPSSELGKKFRVDLVLKDNDESEQFYPAGVDQIDKHTLEKYTENDFRRLLSLN